MCVCVEKIDSKKISRMEIVLNMQEDVIACGENVHMCALEVTDARFAI